MSGSVSVSTSTSLPQVPVYTVRQGEENDRAFVSSTWIHEHRAFVNRSNNIDPQRLHAWTASVVDDILKEAEVRIACPPDKPSQIYGFAVLEDDTIHMVFVRKDWRKYGIATAMLHGVDYSRASWSTSTRDMHDWIRHRYRFKSYKPLWLREKR